MTEHTIEVNFDAKQLLTCNNVDAERDRRVIYQMAQAICPSSAAMFPQALMQAEITYRMVVTMRLELERECAAAESIAQVS